MARIKFHKWINPYTEEDYKTLQKLYEESIRYRPDIFYNRIIKFVFGNNKK